MNELQQEVIKAVDYFYQSVLSHSQSNDDELLVVLPTIIASYNMVLTERFDDFYCFEKSNEHEVEENLINELQELGSKNEGYEEWSSFICEDIKHFRSSKYPNGCYLIYATTRALSSIQFVKNCAENEQYGGFFFELLIEAIFERLDGTSAEFYNSPQIAKLIGLLAESDNGMSLYDPTCGTGSFLLSSAKDKCCLYGQELNRKAWSIAKMNMFMHNGAHGKIYLGDSLLAPKTSIGEFDRVVACPPFSLSFADGSRTSLDKPRFPFGIPQKKADYAFIQHVLSSLNSSGRGVVVVSPGVLFSSGSDKKIRAQLIESNVVKTIIQLPAGLIFGSNISSAILVLETGRKDTDRQIQFIDASNEYSVKSRQHALSEGNISKIVSWFGSVEPEGGKVAFKSIEEIRESDFDLTVSRYTFENKTLEHRAISDIRYEQSALNSKLEKLQIEMTKMLDGISGKSS
ncbi:SAM-dependent methyltransferase [Vibrio chagasii]|uniref:N-6 DNA methylase n=1 Tax=Vibrio chagasii TaxID=170679 RepID=UPI001EFC8B84|nr:N-6 DNA methylase [Vibrio chagasii]MCG9564627.1 SAM-dependent methyltransferase [Vibrio chagasii]